MPGQTPPQLRRQGQQRHVGRAWRHDCRPALGVCWILLQPEQRQGCLWAAPSRPEHPDHSLAVRRPASCWERGGGVSHVETLRTLLQHSGVHPPPLLLLLLLSLLPLLQLLLLLLSMLRLHWSPGLSNPLHQGLVGERPSSSCCEWALEEGQS